MKHSVVISGTAFATIICICGLIYHSTGSVVSRTSPAEFPESETAPFKSVHPGAEEYNAVLTEKIDDMKKRRGPSYTPRTKHLGPNGDAKYTNRLFLESSPYLLQHAHNPVNWYPWGEEAFEEARRLNRPLFVSIGYSTCHWCHVMEEESFEDVEIAEFLNSHYVPVKIDREERPDVDAVYMSAVQLLTGRGGWPLNVWLTPELKPFYGGTYFPARDGDRGPATGFLTFLKKISESYHSQRQLIDQSGDNLAAYINKLLQPQPGNHIPDRSLITVSAELFKKIYDPVYGGVKGEPKFPSSFHSRLMLRHHLKTRDSETLDMVVNTLEKMADGGMYDQAGGGFHRYSTDKKWIVPHFEKMLYDNALLSITYLEAYQATGTKRFRDICEEILDYVKREMTGDHGAFYSATDADTMTPGGEKEEGYYFTWTPDELKKALDTRTYEIVKAYYSIGPSPDFEGRHILHITRNADDVAASFGITVKELDRIIDKAKDVLYHTRNKREKPFTDTKVLASWNGLMISGFARAGLVLNKPEYTKTAVRAAEFIFTSLMKDGRLLRTYKDGQAKYNAYLDDYAFLEAACIDLYEATSDITWLEKAIHLDKMLVTWYADTSGGGFFMTSSDHEALLAREKPGQDGALPSGNSVALLNMLRLSTFTTDTAYLKRSEKAFQAFSKTAEDNPAAYAEMILALDFYYDLPKEILIVTPENSIGDADPFLEILRTRYIPNRIISVVSEGDKLDDAAKRIPLLDKKTAINGKTTAFVCEKGMCLKPSQTPDDFIKNLGS